MARLTQPWKATFRRLSVKTKVTLGVTLFFLLSLTLVSVVQFYHVKDELKTVLAEQQHAFVARIADDLDQKLLSNLNLLVVGAKTISPGMNKDVGSLEAWAAQRVGLRSVFDDILIISTAGAVLADAPALGRHGVDVTDRDYFKTTLATGKPTISKPFLGKTLKQPVIAFAAPVLDQHGGVVAVLVGTLNLLKPNFLGKLAHAKVGKTGAFKVFTRDRTIVMTPSKLGLLTQGPAPGESPYFDRAVSGADGSEEVGNKRGLHAIYSYAQLKAVPWVLVASLPIEEAYEPIASARQHIMQTTLLLGLLVALLVWLTMRRLYDPMQVALREREAGLQHAQAIAKLAHVITTPDGGFESWSDTLPKLLGIAPEQMPTSTRQWLSHLHPDDRAQFRARSLQAGASRQRTDQHYRLQRPDGTAIDVAQVMEPLDQPGTDGRSRWFNTLQDVTEQKRAEAKIKRLNRVHAVLSGINTLIVRVRDRDELFQEACRIAVEHGQFKATMVSLVDAGAQKLRVVASVGLSTEFLASHKDGFSLREDAPQRNTIVGQVMRDKRPIASNDVQNDPRSAFAKECAASGIFSTAVLPLIVAGEVTGVFTLLAGEPGYFDDEEMLLLQELAGDISFALDHIAKEERLSYLAYYDVLTGLANRALFLARLEERLLNAKATQSLLSVTVLDIERLKPINDAFGRSAGDQFLLQVADRLTRHRGDPTRLAHISSETFAVVSADVQNEAEVGRLTELKLGACFGAPFLINGQELTVPGRAGIAMFPQDGDSAETLLRCAESALKRAKESGDRYLFFEARMTERIAEGLAMENELRQALDREEFVLHYQPKVQLGSLHIVGVEALIRWNSPTRGLVSPVHFIPLLEETGLILQVGAWALQRATHDHRRWVELGLAAPRVAVNVSAIQLRRDDFVGVVQRAISAGPAPTGIDLEVTESLLMEDIETSAAKLTALRELGMGISLDDFGTGYSSLAYLAKLPLESLKIDRSFVIAMQEDEDTMTLVRTIISMAHALRLTVVAEGVETQQQADVLTQLGCDQMQGYWFSKPVAFDKLTILLQQAVTA